MVVVLKAAHGNDELVKMPRAPLRTEPNWVTALLLCHCHTDRVDGKTAVHRDFRLERPATSNRSSLGWISADSTCWITVCAQRKRALAETNQERRKWRSDILNVRYSRPRLGRGGRCGASMLLLQQVAGFQMKVKMMGWRRSTVTSGCPVQAGWGQDIQTSPTVSPFLSGTLELSIIQKEDIPFVQGTAWRRDGNSVFFSVCHFSIWNSSPPHFSSYSSLSVPSSLSRCLYIAPLQ